MSIIKGRGFAYLAEVIKTVQKKTAFKLSIVAIYLFEIFLNASFSR